MLMQGFRWIYNEYGAPASRISHLLMTDSEAGSAGEAVMIASGRVTKQTGGSACVGILAGKVDAGTDNPCTFILAREGDVFDAPYTGTPDATFLAGIASADVAADGLSVNAADVTGGAFAILEVNTNEKTCRLKVKNRQLS